MSESLTTANLIGYATDFRVLIVVGILLIVSLYFRWKPVLMAIFAIGGIVTVIRIANVKSGAAIDQNVIYFGLGTVLVGAVLIYYMFIKSD